MLLLIEDGIVLKEPALQAINNVIDVKFEIAGKSEDVVVSMTSIALLKAVAQSIAASDVPNPAGGAIIGA